MERILERIKNYHIFDKTIIFSIELFLHHLLTLQTIYIFCVCSDVQLFTTFMLIVRALYLCTVIINIYNKLYMHFIIHLLYLQVLYLQHI